MRRENGRFYLKRPFLARTRNDRQWSRTVRPILATAFSAPIDRRWDIVASLLTVAKGSKQPVRK